jgi:hypothetical protein
MLRSVWRRRVFAQIERLRKGDESTCVEDECCDLQV